MAIGYPFTRTLILAPNWPSIGPICTMSCVQAVATTRGFVSFGALEIWFNGHKQARLIREHGFYLRKGEVA